MTEPNKEGVTARGAKACAKWLAYCLEIGYKKSQLDALEKLWYQYHDRNGKLTI